MEKQTKNHAHRAPSGKAVHDIWTRQNIALVVVLALVIIFNQFEIGIVSGVAAGSASLVRASSTNKLANGVDLRQVTSTAQAVAAVFPIQKIKTQQDAVGMMVPTGTPEYSAAFGGISFDDPVGSLNKLSKMYPALKQKVQTEHPEIFQRFMNLASRPVGISCEYCCGVGPIGIDRNGNSACGCQHNPAILSITLGLMASTNYNDAQVLHEALRWKALFFPRNMVGLAMDAAGGNIPGGNLPEMVGGC